jgi:hypothetical protein
MNAEAADKNEPQSCKEAKDVVIRVDLRSSASNPESLISSIFYR